LNFREAALLIPLIILMFVMGVYPSPFLNRSEASITATRTILTTPQGLSAANGQHKSEDLLR